MNNKKIKVAIVINDFLVGGAQKLIADQIKYFDKKKFDICLITLFQFENKSTFFNLLPNDLTLYKLNFKNIKDIKSWVELIKIFIFFKPNVVISHLFFSNTIVRILKPIFRYKVISVEHNTYIYKTKLQIFLDRLLSHFTFKIIAVSQTVKDFTSRQEKINPEKFEVILNGIDILKISNEIMMIDKNIVKKELGFLFSDHLIINAARLTPQKNQNLLIDGFALITNEYPDYKLLILGEGSLMEFLQNKIKLYNLQDKVFLFGSKNDVCRYYVACDFFVSTSLIEGFGIAHAEAMCSGLPVLSTKTAGPDKMITEGINGYFISDNTTESVRKGLVKMISSNLHTMSEQAKILVKKYDIRSSVNRLEEVIERSLLS